MAASHNKLLDQICELLRTKHYALPTEESPIAWITRSIRIHQGRNI